MKMRYFPALVLFVFAAYLLTARPQWLASQEAGKQKDKAPVIIIPIEGVIDDGLAYFIADSIARAQQSGALLIIFRIDTPGGDAAATLRICDNIGKIKNIPTVAYITHQALSAGAIISFSCDDIMMTETSIIGSAEPISPFGEEHFEKFVSAISAEIRMRAQYKGHPVNIAMAMVDKDLEVLEVIVDGETKYLTPSEVEDIERRGHKVEKVGTVAEKRKLLALSAKDARRYGVARAIVSDVSEILTARSLEGSETLELHQSWSVSLVRFVTLWYVKLIFIALGLLAIGIELSTPGFGAAGIVGILSFALVFFGHYLAGLAEIAEVLLFVVGLILLLIEVFLIPGFGVVGITGIMMMAGGLLLSFQDFFLPGAQKPWQAAMLRTNFLVVLGGIGVAVLCFMVAARYLPSLPIFRRLVLRTEQRAENGVVVSSPQFALLVGKTGLALTPLHPSGKAEIDGAKYDVVAEGPFVDKGAGIEVVQVEGVRIVIRKKPGPEGA
jgi:membrane-bound serine protease (ClpP class)